SATAAAQERAKKVFTRNLRASVDTRRRAASRVTRRREIRDSPPCSALHPDWRAGMLVHWAPRGAAPRFRSVPTEETCLAAFDLLSDAVIATDVHGRISFVNRAAAALLGWLPEELRGRPLTTIMPSRMHVAHEAGFRRYMTTHHPRIMGRSIRLPALRRDGTEVDVELTLAAANLEPGHEVVIGTLRDLSDRVQLERQLRVFAYMRAAPDAAAHLTSVLDVDHVLWVAVETLVNKFDAALARIWLREPEPNKLRLRASAGLSERIAGSSREYIDIPTHPFKIG